MKFSVFAIAALAAATSSSSRYMVAAAAASRNRKIAKKNGSPTGSQGATGPTNGGGVPIGGYCNTNSDCAIPPRLGHMHAVCRDGRCQSGPSWSSCGATSDCVVPPGLDHAVCRQGKCQSGEYQDYCGQDSDCLGKYICKGVTNLAKCYPERN